MNNIYKRFYRDFYLKTGGFIPTIPFNQTINLGDIFQIRNGDLILLGNIFRIFSINTENFQYGNKLNSSNWEFSKGVTKPYSIRENSENEIKEEFEFKKLTLAFDSFRSFSFRGNNPKSSKILNWNDISEELIVKLTASHYSFRELYLVTETATTSDWTMAVANSKDAELEIATNSGNFGLVDIFGNLNSKTIRSKNIEYYHQESKRNPTFYKAKKLVLQNDKIETLMNELQHNPDNINAWANDFFDYNFQLEPNNSSGISGGEKFSLGEMIKSNEFNISNSLDYFMWIDAILDDIDKLF